MNYVIIGNGILALTTAFRLTQRATLSDKIFIIGNSIRPGSATLAAAAMLNSFAEIEVDSLKHKVDLYRFELSRLATQMWPKFEEDIIRAAGVNLPAACESCQIFNGGCYGRGTYVINNTSADDLDDENFDAIIAALKAFNEPFSSLSPRDIPNYMPEQRSRATNAIFIPNEGWLNPRIVIEKLDAVLRLFPQVNFIETHSERLTIKNGSIDGVVLDTGQFIEGDKYLLATGASITDLLIKSGINIGMQRVFYGVGTSIEIKSPDHAHANCIRTPNRGLACGIYSVPYFQGPGQNNDHILIGATNKITNLPHPFPSLSNIEGLTSAAISQINTNFYRADLVRVNLGWRPTSQDGYPLLGQSSIPNLVIATGTKRDGFHLSPLISQMMADVMEGKTIDSRMEVFAPERKLIHTLTREEAVKKAARHMISAAYQHGYYPSKNRMPQAIIKMYQDQANLVHDQLGIKHWGIPPEMLDMYRYGHAIFETS